MSFQTVQYNYSFCHKTVVCLKTWILKQQLSSIIDFIHKNNVFMILISFLAILKTCSRFHVWKQNYLVSANEWKALHWLIISFINFPKNYRHKMHKYFSICMKLKRFNPVRVGLFWNFIKPNFIHHLLFKILYCGCYVSKLLPYHLQ